MKRSRSANARWDRGLVRAAILSISLVGSGGGCGLPKRGPAVIYLDGAGWYSSSRSVKRGLRDAGFTGAFDTYLWSGFLGPAHDHLVMARSSAKARGLARAIARVREGDPHAAIDLVGLSAGTAVIVNALERLPEGVQVDNVVLLSSSVSARRNLTRAMGHVRGRLYATTSPHDGILRTVAVNADGGGGPPAGIAGFLLPTANAEATAAYGRVVNLPWEPSYIEHGWTGSHVSVTEHAFITNVIAPRLLSSRAFPLDRPVRRHGAKEGAIE